ncbi:hypothetical protein [Polyangium fumosum]|uniref:Uncharacterized protein n=1 Tax=Polyangium fumosum TaxID=889272 RepID=A0A4U1JGP3_9BACT|nr:hypothetical protein [Polyangium fumosum]TKD10301.1 hypothetical protein E8A74_07565 [Polyangium fumosum]
MNTEVRVFFYGHRIPGGAEAVLVPARCGPDVADVREGFGPQAVDVWVTLDETDERLPILLRLLEQHGERRVVWKRDLFTDAELDAAPLLLIDPKPELEIFGGPRIGTTYDVTDACKVCGAGARQTSALLINGEELNALEGRRAASTYYSDLIVEDRLAGQLASSGVTGLSFRGVFAAFENQVRFQLPWRQLCANKTLPPMSPRSTGIIRDTHCACGRSGVTGTAEQPTRLVYHAADLADMQDVNLTWEWFGEPRFNGDVSDALFPYPWFLVTPKVWRIYRDAGVTGFDWLPIRVEEG